MPRQMDVLYYSDDVYIIGYNHVRVSFLSAAGELTAGDMEEIVKKFRDVLLKHFEKLDAEECRNDASYS